MRGLCITLLVTAVAVIALTLLDASAAPIEAAQTQDAPPRYLGVDGCKDCHSSGGHPRILKTEFKTWDEIDKHRKAYELLKSDRSKRMGELLGLEPTKAPECLNCHSLMFVPENQRPLSYDANGETVSYADSEAQKQWGVTCDACHGPSEGWLGAHISPGWDRKPIEQKTALGMFDVFSPFERARICVSCHSGNVKEGKVLEHRFYAAGHPPLPGIELDVFCEEMPKHWRPDKWKTDYLPREKELRRVEMVLAGALAVVTEYMTLIADLTAKQAPYEDVWPDYAFFDCYSCHHDIRADSWRRQRGYTGGVPGRVQPRLWVTPLAGVAARLAGKGDEWAVQRRTLREAFDARAYGDDAKVEAAAAGLATWSRSVAEELREIQFDEEKSKEVLRALCTIPEVETFDFDSARQVAWAIQSIWSQLKELGWQTGNNARVDAILEEELANMLGLALPATQGGDILTQLPATLDRMAEYEEKRDQVSGPARFKKHLDELLGLFSS